MSDSDPILRLNAALEGRYRIASTSVEGGVAGVGAEGPLKVVTARTKLPGGTM